MKLNTKSSESTLLKILEHFSSFIGTMSCSTACLEEQQQRELQQQMIPERINRLNHVDPCKPATLLSNKVLEFVRTGHLNDELLRLPLALKRTTLWPLVEPDVWGDRIRVSEDFTRVLKDTSISELDEYLRPPNWIVSYCPDGKNDSIRLLVISPFEANELIPMFRSGELVTQLRMFAARLHEKQDLLFYTPELSIPPLRQLPYCELLDAELLVFSGTLFLSERELLAYCSFLGLSPPQQTPDQKNAAFNSCESDDSTPAAEKQRKLAASLAESSPQLNVICRFTQNPRELAKRIVELRFGLIPRGSHAESILLNIVH